MADLVADLAWLPLPIGDVDVGSIADSMKAGVAGSGIGSSLYRPGLSPAEVGARAKAMVAAWRGASHV